MKSFTQRWREASDEAKDQPMEDTPTDPKEAQDEPEGEDCNHADECGFCRARKILLEEQTERADKHEEIAKQYRELAYELVPAVDVIKAKLTSALSALREAEELIDEIDTHAGGLYGSSAALERIKELRKNL